MSLSELNRENQEFLNKNSSWLKYESRDIFENTEINILIHQANCFNIMNAGVAYYVHTYYPEAFQSDSQTARGSKDKLGSFSCALVENKNNKQDLLIFNLYSQYRPGSIDPLDGSIDSAENRLRYLAESLQHIIDYINLYGTDHTIENKINIGIPWMIGCGIAGGDINKVFKILINAFLPLADKVNLIFVDIHGNE